jgi:hypothetical protein
MPVGSSLEPNLKTYPMPMHQHFASQKDSMSLFS